MNSRINLKEFFNIYFPLLLQFIGFRIILQIDLIMASYFGENALSAFSIPPKVLIIDTILALSVGPILSVYSAETYKKIDEFKDFLKNTLGFCFIISILIAVISGLLFPYIINFMNLSYEVSSIAYDATFYLVLSIPLRFLSASIGMVLHGAGHGKLILPIKATEIILNLFFNWLFAFKFNMGLPGIYLSTTCLSLFPLICMVGILIRKTNSYKIIKIPHRDWGKKIFTKTLPEVLRVSSERLTVLVILYIVASGSMNGSVSRLAGYSASTEVMLFLFTFIITFMRAHTIVLSKKLSTCSIIEKYNFSKKIFYYSILFSVLLGIIFYLCSGYIGKDVYKMSDEALRWWKSFTIVFFFIFISKFIELFQKAIYFSHKKFEFVSKLDVAIQWGVLIPLCFILIKYFNSTYYWISFLVSSLLFNCVLFFKSFSISTRLNKRFQNIFHFEISRLKNK